MIKEIIVFKVGEIKADYDLSGHYDGGKMLKGIYYSCGAPLCMACSLLSCKVPSQIVVYRLLCAIEFLIGIIVHCGVFKYFSSVGKIKHCKLLPFVI